MLKLATSDSISEGRSYLKCESVRMRNFWEEVDAFVQSVNICLLSCLISYNMCYLFNELFGAFIK